MCMHIDVCTPISTPMFVRLAKHPLTSGILTCMQNTHTHTKKFTLIHRTSESVSGRVGKFFAGGGVGMVGGDGLLGEAGDLGRTGSERENGLWFVSSSFSMKFRGLVSCWCVWDPSGKGNTAMVASKLHYKVSACGILQMIGKLDLICLIMQRKLVNFCSNSEKYNTTAHFVTDISQNISPSLSNAWLYSKTTVTGLKTY